MIVPQTIYAGETPLANTIQVEQTAPMTLTVRRGRFTTTGDVNAGVAPETLVLPADVAFPLTADATDAKEYLIEVGWLNGTPDVLGRSRFLGDVYPDAPAGWRTAHILVFPFAVPPNTTDLAGCTIPVFTVLDGFPEGTTAADWRTQSGKL